MREVLHKNDVSIEVFPSINKRRQSESNSRMAVPMAKPTKSYFSCTKPFTKITERFQLGYTDYRRHDNGSNVSALYGHTFFPPKLADFPRTQRTNYGGQPRKMQQLDTRYLSNKKLEPNCLSEKKEVYKMSYPCASGCAKCSFTKCLGPVRVYVSQFKEPRELFVNEICDGQGRRVIPRHRRKEFRGLVYDKETHSLYPPLPKSLKGRTKSQRIFY